MPGFLAVLALLVLPGEGLAQDPFEIHVYEYETLKRGRFTLEAHLNYVGIGSKKPDGTLAAQNDQFHMTYELTAAVTRQSSVGFMLLSARRPGHALEYAGWRVLPHFYVPRSWHWPVDVGLVTEFSFQTTTYEEDSRRVEVRPIVEKRWRRAQVDLNPVFERALHGPGTRSGWNFEPAARVAYLWKSRFEPSIEYYSETGSLPTSLPIGRQVHEFFGGGDIKLLDDLVWSAGVGLGATPAGPRLVFKSRFEFEFGRPH